MDSNSAKAASATAHVKENSPPRAQSAAGKKRAHTTRTHVGLFAGAQTVQTLPDEICVSLIARAKDRSADLSKLTKDDFDAVIAAEKLHHPTHTTTAWHNAYASFLWQRMQEEAIRARIEDREEAVHMQSLPSLEFDAFLADLLASPEHDGAASPEHDDGRAILSELQAIHRLRSADLKENGLDAALFGL